MESRLQPAGRENGNTRSNLPKPFFFSHALPAEAGTPNSAAGTAALLTKQRPPLVQGTGALNAFAL